MSSERSAGVLLHPTSLPGAHGIGDLGPAAHAWIAWLASAGCRLWQVLPLGPTGYGDSPYQSLSSFAGNPLLISLDALVEDGLLSHDEAAPDVEFPPERVEYGQVIAHKRPLLELAARRFVDGAAPGLERAYRAYLDKTGAWLPDFGLFMALKEQHDGGPWIEWEGPLARREPEALSAAREDLKSQIEIVFIQQFLFSRQWESLGNEAKRKQITIIGDLPIFVAHDSADVWAHPELFELDGDGHPMLVAGVPPDAFSETGQLWGNPTYRWPAHEEDGYRWWIERMRSTLTLVDLVRIDHFRGFDASWQIPAEAETAESGTWVPGPGADLLAALRQSLGGLPAIAEDLGLITPEVHALRESFNLPGMAVLQFAFEGDPDHPYLPDNLRPNTVIYTGTHDNDTSLGWYRAAPPEVKAQCREVLGSDGGDIVWDIIQAAWASPAEMALAPMQDLLGLGSEARMNHPGRSEGNWTWRLLPEQLNPDLAERMKRLAEEHGRWP